MLQKTHKSTLEPVGNIYPKRMLGAIKKQFDKRLIVAMCGVYYEKNLKRNLYNLQKRIIICFEVII